MKRNAPRRTLHTLFLQLGVVLAALFAATTISRAQEARMSKVARGEFTVSLKPLVFEGTDTAGQLGRMSIDKRITGDLVATTTGQMLSAATGVQGSAGYVAIERVVGTLDGKHGSFILQHTGLMDRGKPSLSVVVVPDSGTGELTGIEGEFKIIIDGGKHSYEFSYSLPVGK